MSRRPQTRTRDKNPTSMSNSAAGQNKPDIIPIEKADVVISLNGRDGGKRFLVVGSEEGYSMLADGKGRKLEKPKRKKNKHLKLEERITEPIADKLISGEKVTNNEIRRALASYAAVREEKGGM